MTPYRTLLTLARYWPAVGGSELHTRELAHHLKPYADIRVLSHNSRADISNEHACALAHPHQCDDQGLAVHQAGPQGWRRPLLQGLAQLHPHARLVRPLFDQLYTPVSHRALEQLSADRELIHLVYNGMTQVAEQALRVARQRDIPFIFTPLAHTHAPAGTGWDSPRFHHLYRQADAVIAMTEYERDWLVQRGANPKSTRVCPVGPMLLAKADPQRFRLQQGIGQSPLILFLGRHVASKGYRALAEASRIIWQRHPDARLLFAGPQNQASRAWLQRIDDPRIMLIEQLSEEAKCSALAACDLLCVPSTQESLGVIYLEAWHYGKPVIAADIAVMRTLIRRGVDGLLVAQQPESIAEGVNRLLDDPEMARAMGKAGQRRSLDQYGWPTLAAKVAHLYGQLLGRAPNSATASASPADGPKALQSAMQNPTHKAWS